MLIYGHDAEIAAWTTRELRAIGEGDYSFSPFVAIGVSRKQKIVAGVIYSNFRHGNVEMTMASTDPRWATKEVISALLRYPFTQLGCRRVTCLVKATNQPVRAFLCRLGFKEEGISRQVFDDLSDAAILGMLRSECRWIAEEFPHRQKFAISSIAS